MIIDVILGNINPNAPQSEYWDFATLLAAFDGSLWKTMTGIEYQVWDTWEDFAAEDNGNGAVVLLPGQHVVEYIDALNVLASPLPWVLWIVAGDEERLFPTSKLAHPNQRVWQMTPKPDDDPSWRAIGEGWPPRTREILAEIGPRDRTYDVGFAGQVTHPAREACVAAIEALDGLETYIHATKGFTQGLDRRDYLELLARTKIAPCPAGPNTPDSFRLYEALEAGCVPIVELDRFYWSATADGYGDCALGTDSWADMADNIELAAMLDPGHMFYWEGTRNRSLAKWQQQKRRMVYNLDEDVLELSGSVSQASGMRGRVTVVITTSPTSDPDQFTRTRQVVESIRNQSELENCEIIIVADGIRPEQGHLRPIYDAYLSELVAWTNQIGSQVVPVLLTEFGHQGVAMRRALEYVTTDLVLHCEHDIQLVMDYQIPWSRLAAEIDLGRADVVRLMFESHVLAVHEHLALDREPVDEMIRTAQWSQRPHLARTDWYRQTLETYIGWESRTMVEDVLHGVLNHMWRTYGVEGWKRFGKVCIYAPEGNYKRCFHLDGRKQDPKFDMLYEYDGPTPEGAPRAMSERED